MSNVIKMGTPEHKQLLELTSNVGSAKSIVDELDGVVERASETLKHARDRHLRAVMVLNREEARLTAFARGEALPEVITMELAAAGFTGAKTTDGPT